MRVVLSGIPGPAKSRKVWVYSQLMQFCGMHAPAEVVAHRVIHVQAGSDPRVELYLSEVLSVLI